MAKIPVGSPHSVAGMIHTQVLREDTSNDVQTAFFVQINAPGFNDMLPLNNNSSKEWALPMGAVTVTARAEVDDFNLLPGGSTPTTATAISCKVVFKLKELLVITIGSVDVTASLK